MFKIPKSKLEIILLTKSSNSIVKRNIDNVLSCSHGGSNVGVPGACGQDTEDCAVKMILNIIRNAIINILITVVYLSGRPRHISRP